MLTRLERAKQFLPFEALNGLKEELRRREVQYTEKKELSEEKREELQETLQELSPGEHVIVTYYNKDTIKRYIQYRCTILKTKKAKKRKTK